MTQLNSFHASKSGITKCFTVNSLTVEAGGYCFGNIVQNAMQLWGIVQLTTGFRPIDVRLHGVNLLMIKGLCD